MSKAAEKTLTPAPGWDALKWFLSIAIIALAIAGNVYFSAQPLMWRVGAVSLSFIIAMAIAFSTAQGHRAWEFMVGARAELRKVVWPTRQETIQVTLVVALLVLVTSLILWGIDSVLLRMMTWLTGARGV